MGHVVLHTLYSIQCLLELCVLQLYSNHLELLIFGMPHYGIIHVSMHGITLHVYHGIITCWNILKYYVLEEAGRLSVEYNILFILE